MLPPLLWLRIVFGLPVIAGALWVIFRPARQIKGWVAAALLLYGMAYIITFHFWLKAF